MAKMSDQSSTWSTLDMLFENPGNVLVLDSTCNCMFVPVISCKQKRYLKSIINFYLNPL